MRDLHFEPQNIVRLANELDHQSSAIQSINLQFCPDSEFGKALSDAAGRTNMLAASVGAYGRRVALNSLRVLSHATETDVALARALEVTDA